jgi:hypothetical protein
MRTRFDQYVKGVSRDTLSPHGVVRHQHEIAVAAQQADVYFEPHPRRARQRKRHERPGLLGRMAAVACLLEHFHGTPGVDEIRACVRKLLALHHLRKLEAERQGAPAPVFPRLWALSPGRPQSVIEGFTLAPMAHWPAGFLEAAPALGLYVVVLRDLPRDRDTLLLRLLCAGAVMNEALRELARLPTSAWEREVVLPHLIAWRMEMPQDLHARAPEEKDFLMSTDELYEQWKRKVEAEGLRKGLTKGRREGAEQALRSTLLAVYKARFGAAPPQALSAAIEATHEAGTLRRWSVLVSTRPAEEIAADILGSAASAVPSRRRERRTASAPGRIASARKR